MICLSVVEYWTVKSNTLPLSKCQFEIWNDYKDTILDFIKWSKWLKTVEIGKLNKKKVTKVVTFISGAT